VLLKNFKLSDDIAFRFSNKTWSDYPLTADKFAQWIKNLPREEETVNLFMDYETFGEHQWAETGIFEFLKALPNEILKKSGFTFSTPSEVIEKLQVVSAVHVPNPIFWADEERDLSAWLGNEMQKEAVNKLYRLRDKVFLTNDRELLQDFKYLQVSDHFYYMSTKFFSDGEVHSYFNPYKTPYEAFINYMNVLSDFKIRVDAADANYTDNEISKLSKIISEKDDKLLKYEKEIARLNKILKKDSSGVKEKRTEKAAVKPAAKAITKPSAKTKVTAKPSAAAKATTKPANKTSTKARTAKKASSSTSSQKDGERRKRATGKPGN
jgi:alpha-amylase